MSHITTRLVFYLGLSQLIGWGISYYLIGVFGNAMAADLDQGLAVTYGGFTAALLVMGIASPAAGRAIDRWGGRPVMIAGSLMTAAACLGLASSQEVVGYYAAWVVLGLAMRMTLYDAAFATLARLGGPLARRPISQITLLGGLASTAFWPIGQFLADNLGWRGALCVYAGFALLTTPLHAAIPAQRWEPSGEPPAATAPAPPAEDAGRRRGLVAAPFLYALIVALTGGLASGISAHMIGVLTGLGVGATLAVWISTLRGIGQSSARLGEVLFGGRLSPLALGVLATGLLPLGFLVGLASGRTPLAGIAFALLIGAGNGLVTIVRGTLPLVLFDPRTYGGTVGRLVTPGFFVSALAPLAYAVVIERFGAAAAVHLSIGLATLALAAATILRLAFAR